ncbi:MAG TPA: OmpA family protein [Polyangiales bacterium]|nr:OmpA family protein [Polyangiales bacterium]
MRKLAFIFLALAWSTASSALAQRGEGFALDRFRPAPSSEDGLALFLPRTLPHLRPSVGLTLDYSHKPLVIARGGNDPDSALVKHRLQGHLTGALGLGDRYELFVRAPVLLVQRGDDQSFGIARSVASSAAFGTLSLGGSVRLVEQGPFSLGASAWLDVPSGRAASLTGDDGVGAGGLLSTAYDSRRIDVALNFGARYRPQADFGSSQIGSQLLFGAGAYVPAGERVTFLGELNGAVELREVGRNASQTAPLELLLGARVPTPFQVLFSGAVGLGLTHAIGMPDVRALLQASYPSARAKSKQSDADGDGVFDDRDQCPEIAEDDDGFRDDDGCPELDNDKDGVADARDQCGDEAEDLDGIDDDDGCPDLDNDKDAIADDVDQCANAPEDSDGFQDEDGCPDADNDKDGLLDARDQCPLEPEDVDGFADDDGCPDLDNDKDEVPDTEDGCPTAPGPRETKGCPSAVRVDKAQIRILQRLEYNVKSAVIEAGSLAVLDQVRAALEANPQIKRVRIEGHTDNVGPALANTTLSQKRAEAVVKYLVSKGIDPGRLEAKGWGDERPLVKNDSPENLQMNRRVEFHIVDPAPTR